MLLAISSQFPAMEARIAS